MGARNTLRRALRALLVVAAAYAAPAHADLQKFVYAYDTTGNLLAPSNAAPQCPDPEGSTAPASPCRGVRVNADGTYSYKLAKDGFTTDANLILLVVEVEALSNNTYVLLNRKRRADGIAANATNNGVDVNWVSDALLKALERSNGVPGDDKSGVNATLAALVAGLDADALNQTLGSGNSDNAPESTDAQRERAIIDANLSHLTSSDAELLVSLAAVALDNRDNELIRDMVRKNSLQAAFAPAMLAESVERVFAHAAALASGESTLILDAAKYRVKIDEEITLTTARSVNAHNFFAYSWSGVESESSTAKLKQTNEGVYLVCSTGELDAGSSTDCVRVTVAKPTEAIAKASAYRVKACGTLRLSGTASVNAAQYQWSGPGYFSDSTAAETAWKAPCVAGNYELVLNVGGGASTSIVVEIYNNLPIALAKADPPKVTVNNGSAGFTLSSLSTTTDGSPVDSLLWTIVSQPDGSTPILSSTSASTVTLTVDKVGNYTIELLATLGSFTDSVEVTVQAVVPGAVLANAGPDVFTYKNVPVKLDGGKSSTTGFKPLTYAWSASGGTLATPTAVSTNFTSATLGVYPVTLRVSDGDSSAADQALVTVRNRKPIASDDTFKQRPNKVLNGQLRGSDADGDDVDFIVVATPHNGTLNLTGETGAFTYTPVFSKDCLYTVPPENDLSGAAPPALKLCPDRYLVLPGEKVTFNVTAASTAPKFTGYFWKNAKPDPTNIARAFYTPMHEGTFNICVTANEGETLSTITACVDIVAGDNPANDELEDKTTFTDRFTFKVNDGADDSNVATATIVVNWDNATPVPNAQSVTTNEDTPVSGTLTATDEENNPITFALSAQGTRGTATVAANGAFTYTPAANRFGTDTFKFTAADAQHTSLSATVTVTINPVNDAPVATYTKTLAVTEDTPASDVLTGTDVDNDPLTFALITQATKGTVTIDNASTGAFTYTPGANLTGSDYFFYTVHDGTVESAPLKVSINIANVNDAPIANNMGPLSINADTKLIDKLEVTEVDGDPVLYKIVTHPTRGTLSLNASTGIFTYTPQSVTTIGPDSFTYEASDKSSTSNTGIVDILVLAVNRAPTATTQKITVMEGVAYSGTLTGADPDSQPITFSLASNGSLGLAEINSATTGAFTYTPAAGKSGADYFTFKTSDGQKSSAAATVNVTITPLATLCTGPGSTKKDNDGDGYADYVELEFGTNTGSAASTPFGLDPVALNVSYSNDDDSDGYADLPELWLKTEHRNSASKPSASTVVALPDCFNANRDGAAPVLHALKILTPTLDAGTGSAAPSYALTALDNASGVAKIVIRLTSPSGIEHRTTITPSTKPTVYSGQATGAALSAYAEAGSWSIADITLTDGAGQMAILTKADLQSRGFPVTITVTNSNSDATAPTVSNFEILTPTLDVSTVAQAASFRITTADTKSGIKRVAVSLRSPSGVYRLGEVVRTDNQTALVVTVNTQVLQPYVEAGTWTVTELSVTDQAGNVKKYNTAGLTAQGWASTVNVITPNSDTVVPALTNFQILTPDLDPTPGTIFAIYSVTATDNLSGVSDIVIVLTAQNKSIVLATHHVATPATSVTATISSEVFKHTDPSGPWDVTSVLITDAAGNVKNLSTSNLTALGFTTRLWVTTPNNTGGGNNGKSNTAPVASPASISTNEDTPVNGLLKATDANGDTLTYSIVGNGAKGTVVITNTATGAYTYTPNANANGSDSFSFQADDGAKASNVATVTVEIVPVADTTEAFDGVATVTVNSGVIGTLVATDADGDPLTYTLVSQGSKGSVVLIDPNLGSYQYAPNPNQTGTDTFTFRAADSNTTSNVATITVTIVPEISIIDFDILTPVISNKQASVTVAAAVSLSKPIGEISEIRLQMIGPTGVVYSFAQAVNGSAWPVTVSRAFTTANEPLAAGTWTFINLMAKRKTSSFSETVATDIGEAGFPDTMQSLANSAPVGTAVAYTAVIGTPKTGVLGATDAEGDALTFAITQQPTKGTITLTNATTGAFTYLPTALGADSFKFTASDGYATSTATTINLTNTAVNNAPVAYDGTLDAIKNEAVAGTLVGSDPNGNALVYSIVSAPTKGTVNITNTATGAYAYFPNQNVTGSDSFTFKVNDGSADSNVATISVTIAVGNKAPTANTQSIVVFKGVAYSGNLTGTDPEGAALAYAVGSHPTHGTLSVTASNGAFIYTPVSTYTGADSFTFTVNDGVHASDAATVSIDVISHDQACGKGGISISDSDSDGYANDIEAAMGSNPNSASSVPADVNTQAPNYLFKGDTDSDGVIDHVETWLNSNPSSAASKPKNVLSACFDALSDGIKPRLIGFDIITDAVNAGTGATTASFGLSVSDNASGVKRVRVSMRSPAGAFVTQSTSFTDAPLQRALRLDMTAFNAYSEAGTWTVTALTIFDEAGNRLDLATDDLTAAGLATTITVTNNTGDSIAPALTGFSILTPSADASTGTAKFSVSVSATDGGAGLSSMRVDFMSASGTIVSATKTLTGAPASTTTQLDTPTLSAYLESGTWTVFGVMLVDNAGNSAQFGSALAGLGYGTTLSVTNPNSDTTDPQLVSITALEPTITPSTGSARFSFGVSATDNASGVEKVRIDLLGPSGQIMTLWGNYTTTHPTALTAQIHGPILNTLLEIGTWTISAVEVIDNAGNNTIIYTDQLDALGMTTTVTVQ